MGSVMFQLPWAGGPPTLAQIAERFTLQVDDLDEQYGVVLVDPQASLYVVLIDDSAAEQARSELTSDQIAAGAGIFADPQIHPADPPEL
jgi:hypothetical protein